MRGDENPPADMRFVTHEKAHVTADSSVGPGDYVFADAL